MPTWFRLGSMAYTMQDQGNHVVLMQLCGRLSDADWERLYFDFDQLLLQRQPFAVVIDVRGMSVPELGRVHELAQFLRLRSHPIGRWHLGAACVFDSKMLRGLLAAMRRLDALPMHVELVDTPDLGIRWASSRVARFLGESTAEVHSRVGGWPLEHDELSNAG